MTSPDFASFRAALESGQSQLLWRERVADLETPVGTFLKLAEGKPHAFLLESVEGGAARGRHSAIGLAPDLIWRCRDGVAECNPHALSAPHAFEPEDTAAAGGAGRSASRRSACRLPPGLPPIAAGLFGYLGYDMVRQMERLPAENPDVLGIPEGGDDPPDASSPSSTMCAMR
jgi:anthranilate synthase component 1